MSTKQVSKKKKVICNICYGYGLWAVGDPAPMGPSDAKCGMPTIECPTCGANKNPIKK